LFNFGNSNGLYAEASGGFAMRRETILPLVKAPGMDTTDLAHGPTPTMSPKDPRYAQALQELREVQIAPLK
jgi:hypothetical protein